MSSLNDSNTPCGACDQPVTWSQQGVECESCGTWFHAPCQQISSETYQDLEDISWRCVICTKHNYSRTVFDLHGVEQESWHNSNTNSYSIPNSNSSFDPGHSSTPTKISRSKGKDRPLRLITVNFQSVQGKRSEILNLLESLKPDVVIGTETWLDPSISTSEFLPPTYQTFRKDRAGKRGGGVMIAVRSDIVCIETPELGTEGELLWIKIESSKHRPLYVCSFYRPDVSDTDGLQALDRSIRRAAAMQNAQLLISGDFNFPSWDWNNMTLKPKPSYPKLHQDFIDLLHDTALDQMVFEPTRQDSTLDLVLTNCPSLIPRVEVIPGLSDHQIVYFEFKTNPDIITNPPRPIPIYKRANWEAMRQDMLNLHQDFMYPENRSTEELWQHFKQAIQDSSAKNIPLKTPKQKSSYPWINQDIRRLIKKRDRKYRKMKKCGASNYQQEIKQLSKEIQKQLRRAYWQYTENLFTPSSSEENTRPCLKRFWTYIKHQRSSTVGVPTLKSNGRLITDPKQKAEELNSQFYSAFSDGTAYSAEEFRSKCTLPDERDNYQDMAEINITTPGVLKLLANLNPTKAAGPDGISPRVLKELATEIAPILTTIYTSSLQSGQVPADWREALVTPVFKKGEHYNASNYRPISLTSIPCKIMEHILVSNIMSHLETNNILSPQQHGFRKHHSCETQLLEFTEETTAAMEKGISSDVIIMDFAKAFDRVNHSLLCHKLDHYGIRNNTNIWIANFLLNRRQAVVVDGAKSSYVPVRSGVPQGSVLGPCLFLAYINDLPSKIASSARLFADDTAIYRLLMTQNDTAILQDDLRKLEIWEDEWDMSFHPDKCNQLPLSRSRKPINATSYQLHNHSLEKVNSSKYLGVTIQTDLSWNIHIDNVSAKANRTLGFIRRNLKICSTKTKELAYKALVRPTVEYASSVWDPHTEKQIHTIEKVQRRAARFVLNRHRNTSSVTDMLSQLQWQTLQDRRKCARLSMLFKILHGQAKVRCPAIQRQLPTNRRSQHNLQLQRIQCRTDYRKFSFFPRTIADWNALPGPVVHAPSICSFNQKVQKSL